MNITKQERDKLRNLVNAAMKGDQSYESRASNTQAFYQNIGPTTVLALLDMIDRPTTAPDIKAAREALGSLDDYARMNTGVDAIGPRGVLEEFITAAEHSLSAQDEVLTKDRIREIFLANGFTIKEGCDDLKPYVYAAAEALLAAAAPSPAVFVEPLCQVISFAQAGAWLDCTQEDMQKYKQLGYRTRILYATPSPSLAVRDVVDAAPSAKKIHAIYKKTHEHCYDGAAAGNFLLEYSRLIASK